MRKFEIEKSLPLSRNLKKLVRKGTELIGKMYPNFKILLLLVSPNIPNGLASPITLTSCISIMRQNYMHVIRQSVQFKIKYKIAFLLIVMSLVSNLCIKTSLCNS